MVDRSGSIGSRGRVLVGRLQRRVWGFHPERLDGERGGAFAAAAKVTSPRTATGSASWAWVRSCAVEAARPSVSRAPSAGLAILAGTGAETTVRARSTSARSDAEAFAVASANKATVMRGEGSIWDRRVGSARGSSTSSAYTAARGTRESTGGEPDRRLYGPLPDETLGIVKKGASTIRRARMDRARVRVASAPREPLPMPLDTTVEDGPTRIRP